MGVRRRYAREPVARQPLRRRYRTHAHPRERGYGHKPQVLWPGYSYAAGGMFLLSLRATSQLWVYHGKQDSLPIIGLQPTAPSVRCAPLPGAADTWRSAATEDGERGSAPVCLQEGSAEPAKFEAEQPTK